MTDPQNTGLFTGGSWPWRRGNQFRLLDDNEQFFERMLQSIESAAAYVLLEMYLVESGIIAGRFVEALGRAARRGVRVCVIFDGFGSLKLGAAYRRNLLGAGVELRTFNPISFRAWLQNFLRDHRKLLLVDGTTAFVGGAGLTDEFAIARRPGQPWRDLMVEIAGPVVADWQRAFDRTWRRSGAELGLPPPPPCSDLPDGADGRVALSEARARSMLANGRRPPYRRRAPAGVDHECLLRALTALSQSVATRGAARGGRSSARPRPEDRSPVGAPRRPPLLRQMLRSNVRIFDTNRACCTRR